MIPNGATFGNYHTFRNMHLIPKSKITFSPPPPKMVRQELKGADGSLDYTELATGEVHYGNRKGTLEFLVMSGADNASAYTLARTVFGGQVLNCVLDDDPDMTYTGRFWVSGWKPHDGICELSVDYSVEPYRYGEDNIKFYDWLFDDAFSGNDTLYYGSFHVNGAKARTLQNPTSVSVKPKFTCSAPMTVQIGGVTYSLPQGTSSRSGIVLAPGETHARFTGTGTVAMDYPMEVSF